MSNLSPTGVQDRLISAYYQRRFLLFEFFQNSSTLTINFNLIMLINYWMPIIIKSEGKPNIIRDKCFQTASIHQIQRG